MLNKCSNAGQPSPMQRFQKWHYDCLRQAEAWKQRMLQYKSQEPKTLKETDEDQEAQSQVEEQTLIKITQK